MAKNLSTFQPGSGRPSPEGVNAWCQITFVTGNGCHSAGPGPRIPNYGGSQSQWCVPEGVTKAVFYIRGVGGNTGGICCCMTGSPGNSGASAILEPTMTPGDVWQFCMPAGTCCTADGGGSLECGLCIFNKTVNGDNGCNYLYLAGPSCTCATCNWSTCCNGEGETRFDAASPNTTAKEWTSKKNIDNTSRYTCYNCMKFAGTSHTALTDGGLDSDRNHFHSRPGFSITPCDNAGAIAAACAITFAMPIQQFATKQSHYIAAAGNFTDNVTGAGASCSMLTVFNRGSNSYGRSGGICSGGHGGIQGRSSGGNCYCGSQGGQAIVTIRYK
jgi:hypothetical protein